MCLNKSCWCWQSGQSRVEIQDTFLRGWAALGDETRKRVGHQLNSTVLDCTYDGKQCDITYVYWSLGSKQINILWYNQKKNDNTKWRINDNIDVKVRINWEKYTKEYNQPLLIILLSAHSRKVDIPIKVTLDTSGNPIESQHGSRKYAGQHDHDNTDLMISVSKPKG